MNLASVGLILMYGKFDYMKTKGKYQVGYSDFDLETRHTKLSIYYPCIDYTPTETEAYPPWATEGLLTIAGIMKRQGLPAWLQRYLISFRVPAFRDLDIHSDFSKAKGVSSLIPVIFSHGMGSTRTMNSFMLCELASHGCMVFSVDHTDGSCAYIKDKFYEQVEENKDFPNK